MGGDAQTASPRGEGLPGARGPASELAKVHELFNKALAELDPHMTKEERSVFLRSADWRKPGHWVASDRSLARLTILVQEHTVVGDLFKDQRRDQGYAVPDDACSSYRAMLDGLREMELDLHEHIHKENYILFPVHSRLERTAAGN